MSILSMTDNKPDKATAAEIANNARAAFMASAQLQAQDRVHALKCIREALLLAKADILKANSEDVAAASKLVEQGKLAASLVKRLDLQSSATKFDSMVDGVDQVAGLRDPCDRVTIATALDDDLEMFRVSCPIGVILVIFEARPEVIVNIAALAIKSGNAAILKGGKESLQTQTVLRKVIQAALTQSDIPQNFIQTVESREDISDLLKQSDAIDLVIPRGSNALVKQIQESTKISVMGHADGICNIFVDESAVEAKAVKVLVDSKMSYPAACNAVETLLIHSAHLGPNSTGLWPNLANALLEKGITLHCDQQTLDKIPSASKSKFPNNIVPAKESDYDTEWLSLDLTVKGVTSIAEAITHINHHSSHHTDAIITESDDSSNLFMRGVDSAGVYTNASTRFADGFRYGFGTEVGVSTGKLHARGPVGLEGLMTYKYVIKSKSGEGAATLDYEPNNQGAPARRTYKHRQIDRSS